MSASRWRQGLRAEAARLVRHLPAVTEVMGGQLAAQVLMAASGFLLVRHLPKHEYAWFTLFSMINAMMALVADSGLAAGLNAHGGSRVADGPALVRLVQAARSYRVRLSLFSGVLVGGLGVYLLHRNQCPPLLMAGILAMTLVSMFWTTTVQMNTVLHNLLGHRRLVQASTVGSQAARLLLILSGQAAGLLSAAWACVSAFLSLGLSCLWTGRRLPGGAPGERADPDDVRKLAGYVRETMPNALFACVQAQIGTVLLSAFGHTGAVADLGALSRIAVLFSVVGAPIFFLASPAFARAQGRSQLRRVAGLVVLGYGVLGALLLGAVAMAPEPFLWLLGPQYKGLERELLWVVLGQTLATMDSILWTLALARGWIRRAWLSIPLTLLVQALALMLMDPRTIVGVSALGVARILASSSVAIILISFGLRGSKGNRI